MHLVTALTSVITGLQDLQLLNLSCLQSCQHTTQLWLSFYNFNCHGMEFTLNFKFTLSLLGDVTTKRKTQPKKHQEKTILCCPLTRSVLTWQDP